MVKIKKLDGVRYIRCKIREHSTHMLACTFNYYIDTLEGEQYKEYEIFARDLKVRRHTARETNVLGYGLGDPASVYINLITPSSCELKNIRMHNDGYEVCNYIVCYKDD